jgi:hypothetical protein
MRRFATVITAAAALALAALAYAQQPSGHEVPPGQPAPDPESASAEPPAESPTQSSRFAELVPSDMSATEACSGFKSTTECAAALHAAKNTGISFKDLKTRMSGGEKLGPAIHDLKPGADVRAEVSRAEEQAQADVRAPQG